MIRSTNFIASSSITLVLVGTTDNLTVSPPIANIGCDANGENPRFENLMFRAELTLDDVITTLYVNGKRSGTISLGVGDIYLYDKIGCIEFKITNLKTNDLNQTLTIPFLIKLDGVFKLYKNYNLLIILNKDGLNGNNGSDGNNGTNGSDGNDGNDGAGIDEITKYYQTTLLFNTPSKESLLNWDVDIEEPTELKPYVWMFERTTYTMGKPHSDTNVILFKNYVANGKEMVFQGQHEYNKKYYVNHPYINVVRIGDPGRYFFKRSKDYYTLTTNGAVLLEDNGGTYFINQDPSADNSKYWDDFSNNFQSVATNLLFAEEAFIGDLDTNGITIGSRDEESNGWRLSGDAIKSRAISGDRPKYMLDQNGNTILQENNNTRVFLGNLDLSDTGKKGYGLYAENVHLRGNITATEGNLQRINVGEEAGIWGEPDEPWMGGGVPRFWSGNGKHGVFNVYDASQLITDKSISGNFNSYFIVDDQGIVHAKGAEISGEVEANTLTTTGAFVTKFKDVRITGSMELITIDNSCYIRLLPQVNQHRVYLPTESKYEGYNIVLLNDGTQYQSIGLDFADEGSTKYYLNGGKIASYVLVAGKWRYLYGDVLERVT